MRAGRRDGKRSEGRGGSRWWVDRSNVDKRQRPGVGDDVERVQRSVGEEESRIASLVGFLVCVGPSIPKI